MKDWWKNFFDENYLLFWRTRISFYYTKKEVNFLVRNVPIRKSDKILDLCCGHGRHSLELANRGYNVTGLDYSKFELGLAKAEAERRHLNVIFRQGDARNFRFAQKFDVIINMFTAFGYGSRDDDRRVIHNVSKNLKNGGKFFIDLMGLTWLLRHYKPRQVHKLKKDIYTISERNFDFLNSVNYEKRTIVKGKQKRVYSQHVRVYDLSGLNQLLALEGLKVIKYWGSYLGRPFGLDSKRMLVLAKKV